MDLIALAVAVASFLIMIGMYKMKIEGIEKDFEEWKSMFVTHQERDDRRFDEHTQRLNDQEVAHQAIHTSLQFIIAKLDKIEDKVDSK